MRRVRVPSLQSIRRTFRVIVGRCGFLKATTSRGVPTQSRFFSHLQGHLANGSLLGRACFSVGLILTLGLLGVRGQSETEIKGLVTDETGNPISGAHVGVLDQNVATMKGTQTDTAGRFRVSELSSAALYRVVIAKYGYSQASLDDVKPSPNEIHIRLNREAKVSVQETPAPRPAGKKSEEKPASEEDQAFTLSVAVEEILLNISVEDAFGRPVANLQKEDFAVLQDGVPQTIRYFGHENVPMSAVLAMDTSSSMQGSPILEAKLAALEFLGQGGPKDAMCLVSFNDKVEVLRPFTEDTLQLRTGIHSLTPSGGTALYDAISKSIDVMEKAPHPRHVIILLSDGKDEDSSMKFAAVDRKIQASDVVIFCIAEYAEADRKLFMSGKKYYKQPEYDVNLNPVWLLRSFADLSGGRVFFPKLGDPLGPFFSQIARELHQQYVLTYQPTATKGEGNFHSIEVKVKSPKDGTPFKVRTRKGYLSESPGHTEGVGVK